MPTQNWITILFLIIAGTFAVMIYFHKLIKENRDELNGIKSDTIMPLEMRVNSDIMKLESAVKDLQNMRYKDIEQLRTEMNGMGERIQASLKELFQAKLEGMDNKITSILDLLRHK